MNAINVAGIDIVKKSLRMPCYQIAANAGVDAAVVVQKVIAESKEIGYDARNDSYVDMVAAGILDPTKVSQS